jgi:UDP-3-O-[3-hydroxymyristoyl] glucosamine N-acyltransferase
MMRKLTIEEIAKLVGGKLSGGADNSKTTEIYRVSDLESATASEIAFVEKNALNQNTNAACLIVPEELQPFSTRGSKKLAFIKLLLLMKLAKFPAKFSSEQTFQSANIRASGKERRFMKVRASALTFQSEKTVLFIQTS